MAKGNLFLGTAARSVGDVVMYRREGSQVSRVRVRKVANPRTDAQSIQRAAFSPVAKFFSPLAVVLERAFEGVSKSKSYSEFLKVNIKKARENSWLLPKGTGFFPLPYQLTKGTLPTLPLFMLTDGWGVLVEGTTPAAAPTTISLLSTYFMNKGCQKDDIVTIILACGDTVNGFYPVTGQFQINDDDSRDIASVMPGIVVQLGSEEHAGIKFNHATANVAAGSVVVARFENDKWRRSSQSLLVANELVHNIQSDDYRAAAIASYGNAAGGVNPMVYLDGSEVESYE